MYALAVAVAVPVHLTIIGSLALPQSVPVRQYKHKLSTKASETRSGGSHLVTFEGMGNLMKKTRD